jgi:uncharacterized protein
VILHLEKKGIRIFGIAESFVQSDFRSVLAGVVMRRDLVIDGLTFGQTTIKGNDSTQVIISMFTRMNRNDINCILLGGTIISVLNIIDGQDLANTIQIPVVAVSAVQKKGLKQENLLNFENGETKFRLYSSVKESTEVKLWTGKTVQVRNWGISIDEARSLINTITLQGSRPEPIRIAALAAREFRKSCVQTF